MTQSADRTQSAGPESAFDHPQEATIILLARLYDVGITILRNINKEEAAGLVEAHEKGIILSPAPSFVESGE